MPACTAPPLAGLAFVAVLQCALAGVTSCSAPIGGSMLQRWIQETYLLLLPVGRFELCATLGRPGLLRRPERPWQGPGRGDLPYTSARSRHPPE